MFSYSCFPNLFGFCIVRTFVMTVFVCSVSCKVVGLRLMAILCVTERCIA